MNTENCCRVCLEETFAGFNLQEYNGDSKIEELLKRICPEINVSVLNLFNINKFKLIILSTYNSRSTTNPIKFATSV
jgi:hypothetical protein